MGIIDIFYPRKCLGCGKSGLYICQSCVSKVHPAKLRCIECQKPAIDGMTHSKCKKKSSIDAVYGIWRFEGVIRSAIIKLKYNFATDLVSELTALAKLQLMHDCFLPVGAVYSPIPLYKTRKNWRGFNQSYLLLQAISTKTGIKVVEDFLTRKKSVTPQVYLKGKDRLRNIKGIFELNEKYKKSDRNQPLVIFDDVLTTGATLKEAAKVLKNEGYKQVWGLTLAS